MRAAGVLAGFGAGGAWLALFALIGGDLRGHLWWLVAAGLVAWLAAVGLARYGDRGAAVGVALATGAGWTVTGGVVALSWALTADWPLW